MYGGVRHFGTAPQTYGRGVALAQGAHPNPEDPVRLFARIWKLDLDESGATATEYVILLILIACFIIAIVKDFGKTAENKYANGNNAVARLVDF